MGAAASATTPECQDFKGVLPLDMSAVKTLKQRIAQCPDNPDDARKLGEYIHGTLQRHGLQLVRLPLKDSVSDPAFMDSVFRKRWLPPAQADALFDELKRLGELRRPKTDVGVNVKYPLWALYYGMKRVKDGALALDRWGSYHESWVRVEEPCAALQTVARQLSVSMGLPPEHLNSIVVNYYFDGETTYIPAHKDTTSCMTSDSRVYCLSLGASREFLLVKKDDAGRFVKEDMTIAKEWLVEHGDIFGIGQKTNEKYCHCIPQDKAVTSMRISVVFRSIDKSFIKLDGPEIAVQYADGRVRPFRAELITTKTVEDEGICEHIAWLVAEREEAKAMRRAREQTGSVLGDDKKFFLGAGNLVPIA